MNRFFLVPALGVATLAFAAQAHAQQLGTIADSTHPAYAADARQPYYESRRAAYDTGYREGLSEGERDGRRGQVRPYQDNRTWQRADKGYNRSYGDVERYRQQFRIGFSEGYQAGVRPLRRIAHGPRGAASGHLRLSGRHTGTATRFSGTPIRITPDRSLTATARYGYSAAYPNGLKDGIEKGREDARKQRSFDPLRHDWYREGTRHYKNEYGSKQQYANVYRQAFREGYDRGYRELGYVR